MRNINNDLTLKRNYLSKYRFLLSEYDQVSAANIPVSGLQRTFIWLMIPIREAS